MRRTLFIYLMYVSVMATGNPYPEIPSPNENPGGGTEWTWPWESDEDDDGRPSNEDQCAMLEASGHSCKTSGDEEGEN